MKIRLCSLVILVLLLFGSQLELNAGAKTWKKNRCAAVVKKYNARAHVSSLVPLCVSTKKGCSSVSHLSPAACYKNCGTAIAYYEPGYANYTYAKTHCPVHWAGKPHPEFDPTCGGYKDDPIPSIEPLAESEFYLGDYLIDEGNFTITFSASGSMRLTREANQYAELTFFIWLDEGDPENEDVEHDPENDIWSYTIRIDENSLEGEELLEAFAPYYDFYEGEEYVILTIEGLEFTVDYDEEIDPEQLVVGVSNDVGEDGSYKTTATGIAPRKVDKPFNLFPNPATEHITVNYFDGTQKTIQFNVLNTQGQVVDTKRVQVAADGLSSATFYLTKYNSGMYFIVVDGDSNKNNIRKFIKP